MEINRYTYRRSDDNIDFLAESPCLLQWMTDSLHLYPKVIKV